MPSELIPGQTYLFGFYIGFNEIVGILSPLVVDVTLQGTNDCGNMPDNSFGCMSDGPDWYNMVTVTTAGVSQNSWLLVETSFVASQATTAIALGVDCGPGGAALEYHFFDSIYLTGQTFVVPPNDIDISMMGDCISGVSLEVPTQGGSTYQWDLNGIAINGATSSTYMPNPVINGTYQVVETTNGTCIISVPFLLDLGLNVLEIDSLVQQIICHNDNDGSIEIIPQSQNVPIMYNWNSGDMDALLIDLEAGNYTVTFTDDNGCYGISDFNIYNPEELIITTLIDQPVDGKLGRAELIIMGGQPDYSYNWENGNMSSVGEFLLPGIYFVTVVDALGCAQIVEIEIFEELINTKFISHESCAPNCDGTVTVVVQGGLPNYSINWSNGSMDFTQTDLCPGEYSYSIVDFYGTFILDSIVIFPADLIEISADVDSLSCTDDENANIQLTVSSGSPPYQYLWHDASSDDELLSVSWGFHSVTITDNLQCESTREFHIPNPPSIQIQAQIVNDDCSPLPNGEIDLTVSGGSPPYSYLWSNTAVTEDIDLLTKGNYLVTISDRNNCIDTASFEITAPPELIIDSVHIVNANCGGGMNGSIFILAAGGVVPYLYEWNTGETINFIDNKGRDFYTVTITNQQGCTLVDSFEVGEGDQFTINGDVQNISCFDAGDGEITLSLAGGQSPFSISWSTGDTTLQVDSLAAGVYTVSVTDSESCLNVQAFLVAQPDPLAMTDSVVLPLCFGEFRLISLYPSGGTAPYIYEWNTGADSDSIIAIADEFYQVTVTDQNGCEINYQKSFSQPDSITINLASIKLPSSSNDDGQILINIQGGVPPYFILWDDILSQTTLLADSLSFGTYTIMVVDQNNCSQSLTVQLVEEEIDVNILVQENLCFGDCFGSLQLNITGGILPYVVEWSDGQTGLQSDFLCNGDYDATVTDAANSIHVIPTQQISSPQEMIVMPVISHTTCPGANDGDIRIDISGGQPQ